MTVSRLKMNLNITTQNYELFTGYISCKWFSEEGKSQEEEFHQDMLEKDTDQ